MFEMYYNISIYILHYNDERLKSSYIVYICILIPISR